jgi:hypothetical protein
MKKLYKIILVALIASNTYSQAPNWAWAKNTGAECYTTATDVNGNVYCGGFYSGQVSINGTTILYSPPGQTGMALIKYDALGNLLWYKTTLDIGGGNLNGYISELAVDASGNVFVAGDYDIGFLGEQLILVSKFDANGNFLWRRFPTTFSGGANNPRAEVKGLTTDLSGNVVLTGDYHTNTITFGTTTLGVSNGERTFIVKYSTTGNVVWAKAAIFASPNAITSDASGNLFITGYYNGTALFDNLSLTNSNTNPSIINTSDIFIVKYSAAGNALWAKKAGGIADVDGFHLEDWATDISCDAIGNLYITGTFASPAITFGSTVLTNPNSSYFLDQINKFFIAKYSPTGTALWAKQGSDNSYGQCLVNDASGNVLVVLYSTSNETFGNTTIAFPNGQINPNYIIVKYNPSGTVLWALSTAGAQFGDLAIDSNNNAYFVGGASALTTFGTYTITQPSPILAKLGSNAVTSMQTEEFAQPIAIYPNPFESKTNIIFSELQQATSIKLIDAAGKELKGFDLKIINEKSKVIDMADYAKGLYFLKIEDDQKTIMYRKIILN